MTPPIPLYQNPPTLAESAQPVTIDMTQLVAILAGIKNEMNGNAQRMEANLKANANEMKEETKGMREEMLKPARKWIWLGRVNAGGDAEHGCRPAGRA